MNSPQRTLLVSILVGILISITNAQQRETVVISAASPAPAAAAAPAASEVDTLQGAIKMLQEMKAANEELLKKQEATLQQLDDLQKAAEQLKIFSKRG